MIFIVVLALLIFGPKRLPEVGRTIGKGMAQFRKATSDLRRTIETEIALDAEPPRPTHRPATAPRLAQLQLPGASLPASTAPDAAPVPVAPVVPGAPSAPIVSVAPVPLQAADEAVAVPPAVDSDPSTSQST